MKELARKNIQRLQPYVSARHEFRSDENAILMDANENPFGFNNRYPDPFCTEVKSALAKLKNVSTNEIFLGNGSDEAIDLLFRAYCEPNEDKVLQFTPTYGMYQVSADINAVEMISLRLNDDFQVDMEAFKKTYERSVFKLVFICSPNNPTANLISQADIETLLAICDQSLVIVDEAYVDFIPEKSVLPLIKKYPNLVVLQTFSKAWGLAGLRLGAAYAFKEIIAILNSIKAPYNVSRHTQQEVLKALLNKSKTEEAIAEILEEREWLKGQLQKVTMVRHIYPSDTNFLLVKFRNAENIQQFLKRNGLIVRNQSNKVKDCLRISVGTPPENKKLIQLLNQYQA